MNRCQNGLFENDDESTLEIDCEDRECDMNFENNNRNNSLSRKEITLEDGELSEVEEVLIQNSSKPLILSYWHYAVIKGKEMAKRANKRKKEESDFEEKKMMLPLSSGENDKKVRDDELCIENQSFGFDKQTKKTNNSGTYKSRGHSPIRFMSEDEYATEFRELRKPNSELRLGATNEQFSFQRKRPRYFESRYDPRMLSKPWYNYRNDLERRQVVDFRRRWHNITPPYSSRSNKIPYHYSKSPHIHHHNRKIGISYETTASDKPRRTEYSPTSGLRPHRRPSISRERYLSPAYTYARQRKPTINKLSYRNMYHDNEQVRGQKKFERSTTWKSLNSSDSENETTSDYSSNSSQSDKSSWLEKPNKSKKVWVTPSNKSKRRSKSLSTHHNEDRRKKYYKEKVIIRHSKADIRSRNILKEVSPKNYNRRSSIDRKRSSTPIHKYIKRRKSPSKWESYRKHYDSNRKIREHKHRRSPIKKYESSYDSDNETTITNSSSSRSDMSYLEKPKKSSYRRAQNATRCSNRSKSPLTRHEDEDKIDRLDKEQDLRNHANKKNLNMVHSTDLSAQHRSLNNRDPNLLSESLRARTRRKELLKHLRKVEMEIAQRTKHK